MGGKGGGGGSSNLDPAVSAGMLANETALTKIAQQQASHGEELFQLTEPGIIASENFYATLQSGDPGAIMRAIAPTAQQTSEATAGAKSNIEANAPAGGEKNLALEMTDVNRGAQIAKTASGATMGAPNALGALAGQGIGESIGAAQAGTSAYSAGSSSLASLGQLNLQDQQLQMEQKGQSLGAAGGLLGDAASVGSAALLCPCRGTLILMSDGSEKPIEMVRPGDQVLGVDGDICTVESVQRYLEESIRVETDNGHSIFNSLSHTFIDDNGSFAVSFESLGRMVMTALGSSEVIVVEPRGVKQVFSILTDGSHTYRADGIWALGVRDVVSDAYLDRETTRKRIRSSFRRVAAFA